MRDASSSSGRKPRLAGSNLRLPLAAQEEWLGGDAWRCGSSSPHVRDVDSNTFAPSERAREDRLGASRPGVLDRNLGNPQSSRRGAPTPASFSGTNRECYECIAIALVERSVGQEHAVLSPETIRPWPISGLAVLVTCASPCRTGSSETRFFLALADGKLTVSLRARPDGADISCRSWSRPLSLSALTRIPRSTLMSPEFCRLAGELSIFDDTQQPIAPAYDPTGSGPVFPDHPHPEALFREDRRLPLHPGRVHGSRRPRVASLVPEWFAAETEFYLLIETRP